MNYFSCRLSQALQEAGCISGSRKFYGPCGFLLFDKGDIQAFHPWDICGPSEIARENAKKVFGTKLFCYDCDNEVAPPVIVKNRIQIGTGQCNCARQFENNLESWEKARHRLIDLPSHEEQERYILETLKNGKK